MTLSQVPRRTWLTLAGLLGLFIISQLFYPALATTTLWVFVLFSLAFAIPTFLRSNRYVRAMRPVTYVGIFALPLMAGAPMLPLTGQWDLWTLLLLLCTAVVPLLPRLTDVRAALDREFAAFLPPVNLDKLVRRTWYAYGGAVGEELFFRGFLLPALFVVLGWPAHIVVAGLFVAVHWFGYFHGDYNGRDYLSIALVSLLSGLTAMHAQSLLPSILAHLLFNTPVVLHHVFRYVATIREGLDTEFATEQERR